MAYTFLDNSLNTIGVLTNKGGQTNDYWGDSITHEIATSQDVLTSVSLSVDKPSVNIDTSGNQKTWNHVIQGLSFNIDGIGRKVNENDYLIYQEGTNGKYYLMAITQVDESAVQSGFHYKTVQGLNAAAYDLSRKTLRAKSFAQIPDNTQEKGTAQNILKYIFEGINWDVRTIGSFGAVDYDIAEGTTAQAVLLDIIGMFEAEVDAYVQLNNWGKGANIFNKNGSIKRIFDFSTSLGKYRGETIRYDKNMVSITKTGARDSMYTKLYVNGNNITIADVNKGADFIVDDVANRKYNKLGAVSTPVTYLEGVITNSAIESPTALLAWGKKQLKILNHPRYNYQISATNDDKVQLGDTVIIQDTHASDPIYLKSKVISKSVSLADPANNSFIVGEFSPIVIGADNGLEDSDQIMQLVNQANQTAINAQNKANENAKKIVDTRTDLEKTIDQKLEEGKDYSDSLDEKQKEAYDKFEAEINQGLEDAQKERDEISKKADDMLTTANKYSDDIYSKAVANAKEQAASALSSANNALSDAKSDLTTNLNKEISDRNKAVQTVNSQAQDYATQAKSDAIEAAKTADGQVRKGFKETTDALSSTISQNKEDSDGKISTAQSTATQALDGLKTKVSQTDYNAKTGKLQTDLTETSQTANQAKTDIVAIKSEADSQSAQINDIVSDAKGTKQTISDIKTEQGKQSGSIATLQSRADGFESTVTKVNNLSVGGRNYIPNSDFKIVQSNDVPYPNKTNLGTTVNGSEFSHKMVTTSLYVDIKNITSFSNGFNRVLMELIFFDVDGNKLYASPSTSITQSYLKVGDSFSGRITAFKDLTNVNIDPDRVVSVGVYIQGIKADYIEASRPKLEIGTIATDWTPAPEDLSGATAKAQLTADKANLDLSNYKTDADGRISKAQSDITATSKEVKTKVSQSDYDTKTNDLTTKYGQVKATADSVKTDVAKYKETNDKKVSGNSASINTLNNQITSKVSQTDFDKTTGDLNGKFTQQKQTVDSISNAVTELQAKANAQGQVNQLMNTEFSPDFQGWHQVSTAYRTTGNTNSGSNVVKVFTDDGDQLYQDVIVSSGVISISSIVKINDITDGYFKFGVAFRDVNNKYMSSPGIIVASNDTSPISYTRKKAENIAVPNGAYYARVFYEFRGTGTARFTQPMLVFSDHIGDYVQGNYNNNARVAELELGIDHITGLVNDPKKGLSATANLAANGLSVATKAQNDATTAIQTAKGVQTKVKQMGGINLLVNTEFNPDLEGWEINTSGTIKAPYRSYWQPDTQATTVGWATQSGSASSYSRLRQDVQLSSTPGSGHQISMSWYSYTGQTDNYNNLWLKFYDKDNKSVGHKIYKWATTDGTNPSKQNSWNVQNKWEGIDVPDTAVMVNVSFEAREGTSAYLARPMLVMGSTIGDYVAGNYNNNNSLESTRTQLAGQITDEIKDRKNGDTNTLTQAKNFTSSSITSSENGLKSDIQQAASGVVAQVQAVNRLFNTQFTPDLQGWNVSSNKAGGYTNTFYRSYILDDGSTTVGVNTVNVNVDGNTTKYYAYFEQDVALPGNNGATAVSLSWSVKTKAKSRYSNAFIQFKKADNSTIGSSLMEWSGKTGGGWERKKWENVAIPKEADHIRVSFQTREGTNAYLSQPMLTFTKTAYPYMPGGYHSTSTVLELFDGRFALGIKNNTGNIISGINGDSSGLSIVGKKITVSGDTTFLGTNFMNGALIKNASIDSAKIKNLEVDKLTGNTTNFVKSSWQDAYGNKLFINGDNIAFFTNSMRSATTLSEGRIHMGVYNDYTKITEGVGGMKHSLYSTTKNQDYLNIYLDGWSKKGGHGSGAASHGGDGILFSISDGNVQKDGPGTRLLEWDNELLAGSQGLKKGWHFWDFTEVNGEDFMVTPKSAYQGLRIGSYKYNGTTYPTIMGDQMKGNGPGILMGSTELYFLYKKHVYPLSKILSGATWKV